MKWALINYIEQGFKVQPIIKSVDGMFALYLAGESVRYYKQKRYALQSVAYLKKTEMRNIWEKVR